MNTFFRTACGALSLAAIIFGNAGAAAQKLVILHTNDTHSQIEPGDDGLGGVVRRKALVDSVRAAQPEVMLVDAGDAVQGTLYFTLFGGDVESKVMNHLGYDLQILGNHEFDNGADWIGGYWKKLKAVKLASNYDLAGTSARDMSEPFFVKEVGDKKVGFIAINIKPDGLIDPEKSKGVEYYDAIEAANSLAWYLKRILKVDKVVALTHIGYVNDHSVSDADLARMSKDIDVIIGGHSHTVVSPVPNTKTTPYHLNALGDTVIVAQTGRLGRNVGEVDIDFDNNRIDYKLIPVNSRLDSRHDAELEAIIAPYKQKVDSIKAVRIGKVAMDMKVSDRTLLNWMADFVYDFGRDIAPDHRVDLAIVNKGGIRKDIAKGPLTKGEIMETFPFDNYVIVMDLKGSDLIDVLNSMVVDGGNGVSRQVNATMDREGKRCTEILIDSKPVDPDKTYRVATINYLATGGDNMTGLTHGTPVASSKQYLYDDMIDSYEHGFRKGKPMKSTAEARMHY